ncbi:hypothetical protein PUN28_002733 [Cardiocondyla obscurior]|uniref:YDG domain-containing protein n=1 Tax=Cardiocondyla obscurior TaxID=286306 RepID=A0AAW2GVS1_9HYME
MARASSDASRTVCANTIQQNEKRLREARIKNQGKSRIRQDLNKLFSKLNQAIETNSLKSLDKLSISHNNHVSKCWYGPILGFPPGSWWGIRMDCSRDRVHEPFDADIHEGLFGVSSLCTSHTNVNKDVDFGDYLTLTGQVYQEEQTFTDPFIHNYENQIPLRLIRSYNLQDNIAPNTGYRYDGLYAVISYWIATDLDGTKYNKFALMRLPNQESPSWGSKGSKELSSLRRYIPLTKLNQPNTYDLRKSSNNVSVPCRKRKLSHGSSQESLSVVKTIPSIDTNRRSAPESSIVTRHVFKKLPNNTESVLSISVPDQKLLCLGAATKTHSTNISIRMGLYESSHNLQDTKKSVSTMLQKPSKPIDISIRTALDVESNRLTPKEDSKLVEKASADKVQIHSQSSEKISCNGQFATNNINAFSLNKHRENLTSDVIHLSKHSFSVSSPLSSFMNDTNAIERKEQHENIQDVQNLNTNITNETAQQYPSNELSRDLIVTHEKIPERNDSLNTSSESLCAQDIKSLDSLTPDKILNLINNEIHHPLSKLLIENVIGLTVEECAMWNESKRDETPESKSKRHVSTRTSLRKRQKEADNIKENVACLDNRRYCKYSKSGKLFWKVAKQADEEKLEKLLPGMDHQSCNDVNQKCNNNVRRSDRNNVSKKNNKYLSPLRVQTSLQTIAQHTRSSYDIKTRLRTDKSTVLIKKPEFPNSSIKKNKKRDREIANLLIDANFGPVKRGPRNRRLRYKNNAYAKSCNTFNTVIRLPNKRYKSSFERKSKLVKVSRQRTAEKQNKDKYRMTSTMHVNNKNINNSIGKQKNLRNNPSNHNNENCNNHNNNANNQKKENETVKTDHNVTKTTLDRNLRRKLTRTIPLSPRAVRTTRLHCFRKKQDKKPSTVDATTQCKLVSDNPEVYVIGQLNDQRAILRMEWDKLKESILDVPDQESQIYQMSRICTASNPEEDNASPKSDEDYTDSLQDRASAFVPVNAFDSELRIARLRSIGFKPIIKPRSPLLARDLKVIQNTLVTTSKVAKRDVAEQYHKYANNEDNNIVGYMDDELQYQDIEEEEDDDEDDEDDDDNYNNDDDNEKQSAIASTSMKSTLKGVQSKILPLHENLESPWHGWKKIVTNNRSYWIGW